MAQYTYIKQHAVNPFTLHTCCNLEIKGSLSLSIICNFFCMSMSNIKEN